MQLLLQHLRPEGSISSLYFEDVVPVIGTWNVQPESRGWLAQTPNGGARAAFDEFGVLVEARRVQGTTVLVTSSMGEANLHDSMGLPIRQRPGTAEASSPKDSTVGDTKQK
ncbi:MAG: hypothetical protein AAF368_05110 [Planctomycetota bacterium]